MTPPTERVDEQAAKRSATALLEEVRTAWASLAPRWTEPDTLIYRSGDGPCAIVTTARTGGGWGAAVGTERLLPGLNQVLSRHGFPDVSVDQVNGQTVLRSAHRDGRAVEFRGRSGDLEVSVPAPSSQCTTDPRRV